MRSMLQRSTTISATNDHATAFAETLFRSKKNHSTARSITKAKDRHAPRKTARALASTRSASRGSAKDSAIDVRPPRDANTAMIPPKTSQPMMYLRETPSRRNRSVPTQASKANAKVPTKKIVAGARKYFVPGTSAYGM